MIELTVARVAYEASGDHAVVLLHDVDGRRVLPFKPALLAACLPAARPPRPVQPVTIRWQAPEGERPDFHGWWGDMDFARHLLWLLAQPQTGSVAVILHPPIAPDPATGPAMGRKAVAAAAEAAVRAGLG